jgi:hypothetical protein
MCDWLALSQPLTELSHLSVPLLTELSITRRSGQLTLALEPTSCIFLLWLEACYFCEKPTVSHAPFVCLFLRCLSHPKWSHLCHCSNYITRIPPPYNDYILIKNFIKNSKVLIWVGELRSTGTMWAHDRHGFIIISCFYWLAEVR